MLRCFTFCGALLLFTCCLVVPQVVSAAGGIQGSPKILNLYLNWQMKLEDLPNLARWDVVVLDADQQARYPERVRQLRELHPGIKILAYLPSEEIASNRFSEPPEYPMAKLAARIQSAWYVHDPSGNQAFFWPGSALLNVTNRGPAGPTGERWNQFLPRFIHEEILSSGVWDGVFLDNTFDTISHFSKSPVDLDRDGRADPSSDADAAWREGMRQMLRSISTLNPTALVMGNGGAMYADQLHGALFEHFPSWSWAPNWKEFRDTISKNRLPSLTALNVNTDNVDRPWDYSLMRFGLGSALVGGGYYSFDRGDYGHEVLWWYDEYETPLGAPRAAPRTIGGASTPVTNAVWARDFDRGIVLVNSTNAARTVPLPGVFEKLRGVQDPGKNSGAIVSSVELPARDGLILLRRSEASEIRGSAFQNGAFIRMYDVQGHQLQNGFFAQRVDAPSGVLTAVADLDADGADEVVTANRGRLSIQFGSGRAFSFAPFGSKYQGALSFAIGNTNRDPVKELIVAKDGSGPPTVKVFSLTGKELVAWNAYAPAFSGGVRVGVGDLDGNGLREIVTAAGPGGGPHLRIWKTDGTVWGGSFFAFDPSEIGGVSVAVGDVNGDGKAEIVVGSGQGSVPRVRIFNARGMLMSEIVLGNRPLLSGIQVAATDVNGDGMAEVLVSGLSAF